MGTLRTVPLASILKFNCILKNDLSKKALLVKRFFKYLGQY